MGHEVTIGGERLGAGKKMKAELHHYERSTHDLSHVVRTTMASGTLVPFLSELALPGDTFDMELNVDVQTHPTIGPLLGSWKVQLDLFQVPIRLYQAKLHMNMLGIGLDMSQVPLPQIAMEAEQLNWASPADNQQINPSCIFSYLGMRGLATLNSTTPGDNVIREFNAVPYLGYWDIYKNYYANKQEGIGMVIHQPPTTPTVTITDATTSNTIPASVTIPLDGTPPFTYTLTKFNDNSIVTIEGSVITDQVKPEYFKFAIKILEAEIVMNGAELFENWLFDGDNNTIVASGYKLAVTTIGLGGIAYNATSNIDTEPLISTFQLSDIDQMRQNVLQHFDNTPYIINNGSEQPYSLPLLKNSGSTVFSKQYSQEGLALKTYQSDLFNNWLDTEWIDGVDGISAVTAVSTVGDSFTIDELNLKTKIYKMLNRIAISGGTYDDWLDAVYTHERNRSAENPMYLGGLIRNLVFQEIISNAAAEGQPLGTLAGRGRLTDERKGGSIVAKIDEPSYIMGIISLTPRVDYSQGNKWDTNLKTLNDLHKPALDEIGFQDLITDQMAWFDTEVNSAGVPTLLSAGKQPAWTNYMTAINRNLGNFADQNQQMFMVLNRRYELGRDQSGHATIKDLTTYIDPSKFNYIFADTRLDAQNFWVQIGMKITARRKMSAKVMPNL